MARKYTPPQGWVVQGLSFALDPAGEQWSTAAQFFGARRKAFNWTVEHITTDIERFKATGMSTTAPSLFGLRKIWNVEKSSVCVNADTGEVWWPEISKEVFADGIKGAVDAYWRWQKSRAGTLKGRRVGFPKFKKKGKDRDRCTFTTGVMRLEPDRRHITLPMIGTLRTHENTRKLERLVSSDRAKVLSVTLRRNGTRLVAVFKVAVARPQQANVVNPDSVIGIDVGVRRLATVASPTKVLFSVENPKALGQNLAQLRRLNRQRSRRTKGSRNYREVNKQISQLHSHIASIRKNHIHELTSYLAKNHGTVVVESLDAAGMLQQKGLPGARARRRGLSDAALGEPRRQLRYKCEWYGSTLVEVDRFYPSSKTCHTCQQTQVIGWSENWVCEGCKTEHQRDDNAAINLACQGLGSVGAPVKCGAEHQTEPRSAVGVDTRKGGLAKAGPNNSARSAA